MNLTDNTAIVTMTEIRQAELTQHGQTEIRFNKGEVRTGQRFAAWVHGLRKIVRVTETKRYRCFRNSTFAVIVID